MRHITRAFRSPGGEVVALNDINLTVKPASFTALAGPSGSGKSTLLAIAGCVDRADHGEVLINQIDVQRLRRSERRALRRRSLGLVLPTPADNLLDTLDTIENLRWAAELRGVDLDDDAIGDLLDRVGLSGPAHKQTWQLSGGEQQRLAVAVALVGPPTLVLADEPTASLDPHAAAAVVHALRTAPGANTTLLVASHDANVIDLADTVIHLYHGKVIDQ
ncbi:MAG: ABC transporter ATP-binding protein [Ilumatobacteraceae bacterium]